MLALTVHDAPETVASWLAVTLTVAPFTVVEVEPFTVTLGAVKVALLLPVAVTVDPESVKPCAAPRLTVLLPVMVMALEEEILKVPVEARVVAVLEEVLICLAFTAKVLQLMVILSALWVMVDVLEESLTVMVTVVPFMTMVCVGALEAPVTVRVMPLVLFS